MSRDRHPRGEAAPRCFRCGSPGVAVRLTVEPLRPAPGPGGLLTFYLCSACYVPVSEHLRGGPRAEVQRETLGDILARAAEGAARSPLRDLLERERVRWPLRPTSRGSGPPTPGDG